MDTVINKLWEIEEAANAIHNNRFMFFMKSQPPQKQVSP